LLTPDEMPGVFSTKISSRQWIKELLQKQEFIVCSSRIGIWKQLTRSSSCLSLQMEAIGPLHKQQGLGRFQSARIHW
jgi:hypothetical protein